MGLLVNEEMSVHKLKYFLFIYPFWFVVLSRISSEYLKLLTGSEHTALIEN